MNQDEPGRQRRATTSAKTARPFRPTSRTPESAPRRCSRHSRSARSARRDGAAARPTSTTLSRALKWEVATASSQFSSHHARVSTSTLMRCAPAWTTPWNPPPTLSRRRARVVAETAPWMPPTQTDRDARWLRAARQAKALAWFSLAWKTGEGVLGLDCRHGCQLDLPDPLGARLPRSWRCKTACAPPKPRPCCSGWARLRRLGGAGLTRSSDCSWPVGHP